MGCLAVELEGLAQRTRGLGAELAAEPAFAARAEHAPLDPLYDLWLGGSRGRRVLPTASGSPMGRPSSTGRFSGARRGGNTLPIDTTALDGGHNGTKQHPAPRRAGATTAELTETGELALVAWPQHRTACPGSVT